MKRILFVDDETNVLDGIRRMLRGQRKRWDMEFAVGGEAALQAFETGSFDVVITDMRMPGMDGATLLGHIRDRSPGTARVVLSGYAEGALSSRAIPVAHRFLTKPCSAAELEDMIERVCAFQQILGAPELQRIIGAIGELPSLSRTYASLTRAVADPKTSISQVADIIEQDLAMSAKVLQLVNSAFYGLAQNATSLRTAAGYLGMETIKNLALVTETFRVLVPSASMSDSVCEKIQKHAYRTAAIVASLPLDPKIRDCAYVAALLHDVGRLILASRMPKEFCSILALARERKCEFYEAEEEILGTSHAEIGAYLLGLWGIPNNVVEAVAHHHHPTRIPHSGFDSSTAVYVADLLAHQLENHEQDLDGSELRESDRALLETLGILPRFSEFRELAMHCRT